MLVGSMRISYDTIGVNYSDLRKPDSFNGLLAATGQPLATETEIAVWYGHPPTGRQRN